MSIAFQTNTTNPIQRPRFIHRMPCPSDYGSSEQLGLREEDWDSCSSSSIGGNSQDSGGSSDCEDLEMEAQSSCRGPLETLGDLEEVLPIRRGISKFYSGKSKSFTSLADAASATSIKDIVKPEDPYTKKRKNLLAQSTMLDNNRKYAPKPDGSEISRRQINPNQSTVIPGESNSLSPPCALPPLPSHMRKPPNTMSSGRPHQQLPPCRSFSLSDAQFLAALGPIVAGFDVRSRDKENKLR